MINRYTCPHCGAELQYCGVLGGKYHYWCADCDTTYPVSTTDLSGADAEYADDYRTWAYNGEEI